MHRNYVKKGVVNILGDYMYNGDKPDLKFLHDGSRMLPPLDRYLRQYFTKHKSIGSGQRTSISDRVYALVKYEYLLAYLTKAPPFDIFKRYTFDRAKEELITKKMQLLNHSEFSNAMHNPALPAFLRVSQNKILFKELSYSLMKPDDILNEGSSSIFYNGKSYALGNEKAALQISEIMNERAPLTLRINPLKTTKWKFVQAIESKFDLRLEKCQYAPFAFQVAQSKHVSLLQTEEFKAGHFQIQDQGSQLAAMRVRCKPGDLILDFCGGSGGKSLAISHLTSGKGQIFVHEPRQVALQKAKIRFARAGVNNVQFHKNEDTLSKVLLRKADWIILDVPCTGTGTLRRNADIKLRFTEDLITKYSILQREIFAKAMKYLKDDGRIVYITCSLLKQENEDQVVTFCRLHNLEVENDEVMKVLPTRNGMDGFFAVVLRKMH